MAKYKIVHHRERCISCGACAAICPENWFIADDGKSSPKKIELEELGCNQQASEACPVQIIEIIELK
jgi:ferredoxin